VSISVFSNEHSMIAIADDVNMFTMT